VKTGVVVILIGLFFISASIYLLLSISEWAGILEKGSIITAISFLVSLGSGLGIAILGELFLGKSSSHRQKPKEA